MCNISIIYLCQVNSVRLIPKKNAQSLYVPEMLYCWPLNLILVTYSIFDPSLKKASFTCLYISFTRSGSFFASSSFIINGSSFITFCSGEVAKSFKYLIIRIIIKCKFNIERIYIGFRGKYRRNEPSPVRNELTHLNWGLTITAYWKVLSAGFSCAWQPAHVSHRKG